jgi:hypothetical protein
MLFAAVIVCLMGIMYQANTSSSFYPGALDGVTAVVMIDIIVAILYYFTVLFSEIAILYNEDNKRKQLEKAARQRGGKADASPSAKGDKSPRDAAGGRLVDEMSGEINTGRLETATNPLFLSQSGGASGAASGLGGAGADALIAQRAPPPPELWSVLQLEWSSVQQQLAAVKAQLAEARKAGSGGGGAGAAGADDEPSKPVVKRAAKAEFAPSAADSGGSAAIKLLKAKTGASKRAAAF